MGCQHKPSPQVKRYYGVKNPRWHIITMIGKCNKCGEYYNRYSWEWIEKGFANKEIKVLNEAMLEFCPHKHEPFRNGKKDKTYLIEGFLYYKCKHCGDFYRLEYLENGRYVYTYPTP